MRLTRVLLAKRKKGQLRTPKNYQNPTGIQGLLTHTRGVELIPKIPKVTHGGGLENIYRGRVRRVIQLKSPWDVKRDLELEQVARVNSLTLDSTPSYLNAEEERLFESLLKSKTPPKYTIVNKLDELSKREKLEKKEGKNMERMIWLMRRSGTPRPQDLARKYQPGEVRVDLQNTDQGLQENKGQFRPGDPQKPFNN